MLGMTFVSFNAWYINKFIIIIIIIQIAERQIYHKLKISYSLKQDQKFQVPESPIVPGSSWLHDKVIPIPNYITPKQGPKMIQFLDQ